MPSVSPVLEDARADEAEETPDSDDEADVSARSLDEIIDAYARAAPEESTTSDR